MAESNSFTDHRGSSAIEASLYFRGSPSSLSFIFRLAFIWYMALDVLPAATREKYHVEERRHACAILAVDFGHELQDVVDCLDQFALLRTEIEAGGGGKSKIAKRFDTFLAARDWKEKSIKVGRQIGDKLVESETHKVDFSKGRIAVEVEWNNKDPFFSRDLNAFRLLHELDVISAGVIITRRGINEDRAMLFAHRGQKVFHCSRPLGFGFLGYYHEGISFFSPSFPQVPRP
jgi:hypothetical protein